MKKFIVLLTFLLFTFTLFSQIEQHEIVVINVTVPVRVFDGKNFIDNLTIQDFEVYQDGQLQDIKALYLTKKTQIERREEARNYMPLVSRRFYFLFQILDYNPKLAEAMDYFFTQVLLPGDALTVMTPMKTYNLSPKALKTKSKEALSNELQSIIKKDTKIGASNYNSLLQDLKRLVRSISTFVRPGAGTEGATNTSAFGLEQMLPRYRDTVQQMERLRMVDEKKFFRFAAQLKRFEGQKNVFLFYQREFRPEIQPAILNRMLDLYQDNQNIQGQIQDLFQVYHREISMNTDLLKQAFADSSLLFNFIFMNKEPENITGLNMREQSEDMFSIFSEVAQATGGIVDTSQNPAYAFKNASDISESYYLLFYSPENYRRDGKFKNIEVKVKNKDYKIIYRRGYFAR